MQIRLGKGFFCFVWSKGQKKHIHVYVFMSEQTEIGGKRMNLIIKSCH